MLPLRTNHASSYKKYDNTYFVRTFDLILMKTFSPFASSGDQLSLSFLLNLMLCILIMVNFTFKADSMINKAKLMDQTEVNDHITPKQCSITQLKNCFSTGILS